MITLKILKPYHIKVDEQFIRLKLEHQFFSIYVDGEEYQFIPNEAKEIRVDRHNKKIDNIDATFSFQKGEKVISLSMAKLIYQPDFLNQVYTITRPYYKDVVETSINKTELELIIDELERANRKRLIDQALDAKDEKAFYELVEF